MIRTACIAASLLAGTLLGAQGASAAMTLNGRISQVVNALHSASFSASSMSFAITQRGTATTLFTGIEGVRAFNDFTTLNDWAARQGSSVFQGGGYRFTHSVLGSYFDAPPPAPAPGAGMMMMALAPEETLALPQNAPVPEPATWAMMIGGFALAGAALRRPRGAAARPA